jgi:small subunit ribosomal protein S15
MSEEKEKSAKPDWLKMKPAEVEKIILELAKEGNSPEKIGLILRDKHGIPKAKLLGKKITQILKENKIAFQTAKDNISGSIKNLERHIKTNKHDNTAKRSMAKKQWMLVER